MSKARERWKTSGDLLGHGQHHSMQSAMCMHLYFGSFSNFHASEAIAGSSIHTQPQLDATESSHPSLHKDLRLWELPASVKSLLPPGGETCHP